MKLMKLILVQMMHNYPKGWHNCMHGESNAYYWKTK